MSSSIGKVHTHIHVGEKSGKIDNIYAFNIQINMYIYILFHNDNNVVYI